MEKICSDEELLLASLCDNRINDLADLLHLQFINLGAVAKKDILTNVFTINIELIRLLVRHGLICLSYPADQGVLFIRIPGNGYHAIYKSSHGLDFLNALNIIRKEGLLVNDR